VYETLWRSLQAVHGTDDPVPPPFHPSNEAPGPTDGPLLPPAAPEQGPSEPAQPFNFTLPMGHHHSMPNPTEAAGTPLATDTWPTAAGVPVGNMGVRAEVVGAFDGVGDPALPPPPAPPLPEEAGFMADGMDAETPAAAVKALGGDHGKEETAATKEVAVGVSDSPPGGLAAVPDAPAADDLSISGP
jgi:hypothetical protein